MVSVYATPPTQAEFDSFLALAMNPDQSAKFATLSLATRILGQSMNDQDQPILTALTHPGTFRTPRIVRDNLGKYVDEASDVANAAKSLAALAQLTSLASGLGAAGAVLGAVGSIVHLVFALSGRKSAEEQEFQEVFRRLSLIESELYKVEAEVLDAKIDIPLQNKLVSQLSEVNLHVHDSADIVHLTAGISHSGNLKGSPLLNYSNHLDEIQSRIVTLADLFLESPSIGVGGTNYPAAMYCLVNGSAPKMLQVFSQVLAAMHANFAAGCLLTGFNAQGGKVEYSAEKILATPDAIAWAKKYRGYIQKVSNVARTWMLICLDQKQFNDNVILHEVARLTPKINWNTQISEMTEQLRSSLHENHPWLLFSCLIANRGAAAPSDSQHQRVVNLVASPADRTAAVSAYRAAANSTFLIPSASWPQQPADPGVDLSNFLLVHFCATDTMKKKNGIITWEKHATINNHVKLVEAAKKYHIVPNVFGFAATNMFSEDDDFQNFLYTGCCCFFPVGLWYGYSTTLQDSTGEQNNLSQAKSADPNAYINYIGAQGVLFG